VLLGLGVALAAPDARAEEDAELTWLLYPGLLVGCANVVFSIGDIVAVAKDEVPGLTWSIVQSAIEAPGAVMFGAATAVTAAGEQRDKVIEIFGFSALAAWSGTLAANGLWSAIDQEATPAAVAGVSPVIGANMAMTAMAVGHAATGRWSSLGVALFETFGGVPGTVLGTVELARGESQPGLWIALTAWSGTIVTHGIVSSIVYGATDSPQASDPAQSPAPTPPGATLHVLPTTLRSPSGALVPGAMASGRF
jgi:hypothetical protein